MTVRLRAISVCAIAVVTAAGCGGQHHAQSSQRPRPKLPHTLAVQLAAASANVANELDAGDPCGALATARTLQQQTIEAINGGRVAAPLQEPLQSAATDLAARIRCVPQPGSSPPAVPAKKHGHEHKDHGKHKGDGKDEGD